jgi:hypothetical protein
MKSIKYEQIEKQYNGWVDYYRNNTERGKRFLDFVIANKQWDDDVVDNRENQNKESLTFNQVIKHLRRMQAQIGEIEFTLDIAATNDKYLDNVAEQYAFRLALNSILLSDDALNKFREAANKCLTYGWSFAEITFCYENDDTCNLIPDIVIHKDPSIAFWDKNAMNPTKVDGKFCGYCRTLTKQQLEEAYPSLKNASWIMPTNNRVFDYWWRECKDVEYVTLNNGVQKRRDLLTPDEKTMIDRKAKVKERGIDEIYYQRTCKGKVLEKPRKYPLQDLPLIYHPGMSEWSANDGEITTPYGFYTEGAQKLHNYSLSQAATQAKQLTSDKWLFSAEHVLTQSHKDNAKNINKRDGGLDFGGDIQKIRREQPAQLSQTIVELANITKQEIDEINGAMIDTQNAQQTVIAAKALDKITHNMEAINMYFEAGHIVFVNQIGKSYRQMIPELFTQERTLLVKKKDGSGQTIVINQDAGTGYLINNIKDINNNFHYEITAGPSSTMQKENTVKYLLETYSIQPTNPFFAATAHIFFRNLDSKDAAELERIAMAMGDENLIKYSQGEITLDEYKQAKQQAMKQQLQMQQQMSQLDPQVQSANAIAQAEHRKASADEFNAQTKRMQTMNDAQQKQSELKIKMVDMLMKDGYQTRQQDIDNLRAELDQNQQIIDSIKMGHDMQMAQGAQDMQAQQAQQGQNDTSTTETE